MLERMMRRSLRRRSWLRMSMLLHDLAVNLYVIMNEKRKINENKTKYANIKGQSLQNLEDNQEESNSNKPIDPEEPKLLSRPLAKRSLAVLDRTDFI